MNRDEGTGWAEQYFFHTKLEEKTPRIFQGKQQGGNRILITMQMSPGESAGKRAFEDYMGALARAYGGPEGTDNRRPMAPLPSERYLWATGGIPQLPPMGRGGPAI